MTNSPDPFGFGSFDPDASASRPAPATSFVDADDAPTSLVTSGTARPPLVWLGAAGLAGVTAVVLAALADGGLPLAAGAWVVAGPVGIALLAVFGHRDTRERAKPFYSAGTAARVAYGVAVALVAIGVLAAALRIAEWAGRI